MNSNRDRVLTNGADVPWPPDLLEGTKIGCCWSWWINTQGRRDSNAAGRVVTACYFIRITLPPTSVARLSFVVLLSSTTRVRPPSAHVTSSMLRLFSRPRIFLRIACDRREQTETFFFERKHIVLGNIQCCVTERSLSSLVDSLISLGRGMCVWIMVYQRKGSQGSLNDIDTSLSWLCFRYYVIFFFCHGGTRCGLGGWSLADACGRAMHIARIGRYSYFASLLFHLR